jgi:beta-mannosidase
MPTPAAINAVHLDTGWQLAAATPNSIADPAQLSSQTLAWRDAVVPGTVAQSMAVDINSIDNFDAAHHYDAQDWWYRCKFKATSQRKARLRFAGLATLADIWLNGAPILNARNMFVAHDVVIGQLLREDNELVICFRSLDSALAARRPRPRWKTALVDKQALRWFRTTLLGRVAGWMPLLAPVGPYQNITLEYIANVDVATLDLQTSARANVGQISIAAELVTADTISAATLWVDDIRLTLAIEQQEQRSKIHGNFSIADIKLWWPHTHGTPQLSTCRIEVTSGSGNTVIDCGKIGFKEVLLDRSGGKVQLQINGVEIFCRGACWTVDDITALVSEPTQLRRTLQLARDSGANMLRIGGTMNYECDEFYRLCDELGLLVWQDFMFANMDYPFDDADFRNEVNHEITYQLQRLQKHICIAVYCGNSEVEQQAAMVGLPPSEWRNDFFSEQLPQRCAQLHRDIPYFPSSPCEGAMPFHIASGISHYYGVSAYRRPLTDVKHAQVKFATESLCFANVPDQQTIELLLDGATPAPHHPRWKARVGSAPANFDFEAIRDDYLRILFKVDPAELRHCDSERYYALSRVVSSEIMRTVFAEWRKPNSNCGGGLIWFYKDFWPGAGWGIIDSTNRPKAAYWYLRRAWASRAILISDEGLDGLQLHAINETASALNARIEFEIYQHGRIKIAAAEKNLQLPARGAETLSADALCERFYDANYSYRFGPSKHDVVIARLIDNNNGSVLSEDCYFPLGFALPMQEHAKLTATASFDAAGNVVVTLESDVFLQSVALSTDGFTPDNNYFHLAPNRAKRIYFTGTPAGKQSTPQKFKTYLSALNSREGLTLRAEI